MSIQSEGINIQKGAYKDPRPSQKALRAAHKADTVCEDARECTSEGGSSEKETNPELQLMSWIPESEAEERLAERRGETVYLAH